MLLDDRGVISLCSCLNGAIRDLESKDNNYQCMLGVAAAAFFFELMSLQPYFKTKPVSLLSETYCSYTK